MSARETDRGDKRQWVQQYVERQKAYLPTYTNDRPFDQRHATPSNSLRCDGFGFDTPVLRPRVPVNKTSPKAGPSKSQAHGAKSSEQVSPDTAPNKKDKPRTKRKKADTDDERAARLADRRERKRKKRAIVNPPREHDDDETVPTVPPRKGRTKGQKAKKHAALALLYGFSATNVTKDRLTLKPTPSLGVFSKGRASTKKKITAAAEFSESAFLNKPSERAADHSKIDDGSDDRSVSSISNNPAAQVPRMTNHTKKDRGKFSEAIPLKTPQASTRPTAESEVWDIELQSKLPSSVRDVSSSLGANESAPVVLDPRGAKWSASLHAAVEQDEHRNKTRARSLSVIQHSEMARSNLHAELGIAHVEDAPSIHPSHSASQVGRCVTDIQLFEPRQVTTSKYFTESKPVLAHEIAAISQPTSRSNDDFGVRECRLPDQDVQDGASHVPTAVSPINSLTSVAQPMLQFQTRYDMAPLVFSSDGSLYDDCCARADAPLEPHGDGGYVESCAVEQSVGIPEYDVAQQGTSAGLTGDDSGYYVSMEDIYDPLVPEYEYDLEETVSAMCDPGEAWSRSQQDSAVYEDEDSGEDVAAFLEGRALLLGVPQWPQNVGLSGLAQAEMDVASRLGGHWRRQRLW